MNGNWDIEPGEVKTRLDNRPETAKGYSLELYNEAEQHFDNYTELVNQAVNTDNVDSEILSEAYYELEVANLLLEKAECDVQMRDGAYQIVESDFK